MNESSLKLDHARPCVTHTPIHHADGRSANDPAEPVSLVAEHPDAAPQPGDTILRMVLHALVLIAVLLFVAYDCLWLPFQEHATTALDPAHEISIITRLLDPLSQSN